MRHARTPALNCRAPPRPLRSTVEMLSAIRQIQGKEAYTVMHDEIHLRLTQEEAFLLLTGARLFDKLVAGVTIAAEERDELIREVISKMTGRVNAQMDSMSNELAEAIVESVLGCGEMDPELDDMEIDCIDSDMEEMLLREFFNEHHAQQLLIEGLGGAGDERCEDRLDENYAPDAIDPYSCEPPGSRLRTGETSRIPSPGSEIHGITRRRFEQFMREETFNYPMYSVKEKIPVLEKALMDHRAVRTNYYSTARETVDTINLNPLVLLQEDGMWLIVAYCHEKDDIFIFRVDRIKDVFETQQKFETPRNFNELRCKMLATYK